MLLWLRNFLVNKRLGLSRVGLQSWCAKSVEMLVSELLLRVSLGKAIVCDGQTGRTKMATPPRSLWCGLPCRVISFLIDSHMKQFFESLSSRPFLPGFQIADHARPTLARGRWSAAPTVVFSRWHSRCPALWQPGAGPEESALIACGALESFVYESFHLGSVG